MQEVEKRLEEETSEAKKLLFDKDKFAKALRGGDEATRIIKTQLYAEHILVAMILDAFTIQNEMDVERIWFPTK